MLLRCRGVFGIVGMLAVLALGACTSNGGVADRVTTVTGDEVDGPGMGATEGPASTPAVTDTTAPPTSELSGFTLWLTTNGAGVYRAALETLVGPCEPPWRSTEVGCVGGIGETLMAGGPKAVLSMLPSVAATWARLAQAAEENDDGSDFARSAIEAFGVCRDGSAAQLEVLSEEDAIESIFYEALSEMADCPGAVWAIDERLYEITNDVD